MKKTYRDIDPDFLEVVKGKGIKDKISIIIFIIILIIIFIIILIFIYNKVIRHSNKTDNNIETEEKIKQDDKTMKEENIKTINSVSNDTLNASKEYYCIDGYKLEGDKCIYSSSMPANAKYSCVEGELKGDTCFITKRKYSGIKSYNENGRLSIGCEDGYTFDPNNETGMTCFKEEVSTIKANVSYNCPSNYMLSGTNCVSKAVSNALYKYKCPSGYRLSGDKCIK